MLDKLFLKYLTKQGKIFYWVGQIILLIGLAFYLFGIEDNSFNEDNKLTFILYAIGIVVIWGGICLLFFRKRNDTPDNNIIR